MVLRYNDIIINPYYPYHILLIKLIINKKKIYNIIYEGVMRLIDCYSRKKNFFFGRPPAVFGILACRQVVFGILACHIFRYFSVSVFLQKGPKAERYDKRKSEKSDFSKADFWQKPNGMTKKTSPKVRLFKIWTFEFQKSAKNACTFGRLFSFKSPFFKSPDYFSKK